MTTPSATEVWNALMQDAEFSAQPAAVLEVMRPFMEATPEVLADLLDLPATMSNLMNAKTTFLRYAVENGYIAKVIAAMPQESFAWMDADSMSKMMTSTISQLIEVMEPLLESVQELLDAQNITEDDIMLSEKVGFNKELKAMYQEGTLTIAEVLRQQPMIIIKNTD